MIALLGTLLLVRCAYSFIPVKPVLVGESVMFNCDFPSTEISQRHVNWYKQSPGENLRLIVKNTLKHQKPATSVLSPEFSDSRWVAFVNETFSSLKILRAIQEDEGTYHCAVMDWFGTNKWNGTYLNVKGDTLKTSHNPAFPQLTVLDPGLSADHGTLRCSVFTDRENKMCSENLSVFWLRAEAEESHPDIIYIDNNKRGECEKKSDGENSCFYHFSKDITSPDSAFYYCAIATCGKILFGNVTKKRSGGLQLTVLVILAICLVISVIVNVAFICYRSLRTGCKCLKAGRETTTSQERNDFRKQLPGTDQDGNSSHAALNFCGGNVKQGRKKKKIQTEGILYSQVKFMEKPTM